MPAAFLPAVGGARGRDRASGRDGEPAHRGAGPGGLLGLQRRAGNTAVTSLLRGATVQRAGEFGLALPAVKDKFTASASGVAFGMHDEGVEAFARALVNEANAVLDANGVTRCGYLPKVLPADTAALFKPSDWQIQVDLRKVRASGRLVRDVPPAKASGLAQTIYHEARHAEQHFRTAQLLASRKVASTPGAASDVEAQAFIAGDVAGELNIPLHVAWRATTTPSAALADPASVTKIEGWRAFSKGGKYNEYQRSLDTLRDDVFGVVERRPPKSPDPAKNRAAMAAWAAPVISVSVPAWKVVMDGPFSRLAGALAANQNPDELDKSVRRQFGNVMLHLTRTLSAARRVRQAAGDTAKLNVAQDDLSYAVLALYLALNEAYEAYPHEADIGEATKGVGLVRIPVPGR